MLIVTSVFSCIVIGVLLGGQVAARAIQGPSGYDFSTSSVSAATAQSIKHYSLATNSQPDMKRELQAVIDYNCPHGGSVRREFRWKATYTIRTGNLKVRGTHNIDRVAEITINQETSDFFTHWEHSYCIESINYSCSYLIRAHTYGKVYFNSISMYMTEFSFKPDENPIVHENCVIYGPHARHSCPSVTERTGIHSCDIEHITVTTIT